MALFSIQFDENELVIKILRLFTPTHFYTYLSKDMCILKNNKCLSKQIRNPTVQILIKGIYVDILSTFGLQLSCKLKRNGFKMIHICMIIRQLWWSTTKHRYRRLYVQYGICYRNRLWICIFTASGLNGNMRLRQYEEI